MKLVPLQCLSDPTRSHSHRCKRILGALSIVACLVILMGCPPPSAGWVRLYGGSSPDYGQDVQQTSDGGYVIAGTTFSYGTNGDMYLLKIAANGNLTWSYNFGGFEFEHAYRVVQCDDGGYVMLGTTTSFGAGGVDACLVKVNSTGGYLWFQTYGTAEDDFALGLAQCADGGYIIAGSTPNAQNEMTDIYLVKTDENGNEDWSQSIDYGGEEQGTGVVETSNGFAISGMRIAGEFKAAGDIAPSFTVRMCLVRTDAAGIPKWMKEYGDYSGGMDLCATSDGGFIVAGASNALSVDPTELGEGFAVKTDAKGDEAWSLVYDSPGEVCWLTSVQQTTDGGYIFAGDQGNAALLLRADEDGMETWSRRFGGTGSVRSDGNAVVESVLGGYCLAGSQFNDTTDEWSVYAVKTDALGNTGLPLLVVWP